MKAILHQARGRVDRPGTRVRFLARSRHCGHVWTIRAKLQLEKRMRDLALFNLAIDSKLRGCDLVALRWMTWPPMAMKYPGRAVVLYPAVDRRKCANFCREHVQQCARWRLRLFWIENENDEAVMLRLRSDDPAAISLLAAIRTGDLPSLQGMLAKQPAMASAIIGEGAKSRTPLHVATDWPGHFS